MTDAYTWVKKRGIMTERDYPYNVVDTKACQFNFKRKVASCVGFVELPTGSERELKKAVARIGPISIGIQSSFLSMQFYSSGIYFEPLCDPLAIDHAVLLVGYGTENGQDYWLIKNSWVNTRD